jgi:hypothetical protein
MRWTADARLVRLVLGCGAPAGRAEAFPRVYPLQVPSRVPGVPGPVYQLAAIPPPGTTPP